MNELLAQFRDRHLGETAWLFGKGPSLDPFLDGGHLAPLIHRPGHVLCAVNENVRDIVTAPYAFASDNCSRWQHLYPADVVLFQPRRILSEDVREPVANPKCQTLFFDEIPPVEPYGRLAQGPGFWLEHGLATLPGTITAALQVLCIMGIRCIVCVGIDGGEARAQRDWFTLPLAPGVSSYDEIKSAFIKAASVIGTELLWWSPPFPLSGTRQPSVDRFAGGPASAAVVH